jgi:hypothetical protein
MWQTGWTYYQASSKLQKILFVAGTFLFLVMIFHLVALVVTGGSINGPVSFRKSATFAETGWLMCWSIGHFLPLLNLRRGERISIAGGVLLFGIGETLIATVQAWRGVPFHYNVSSLFNASLFYLGGLESILFSVAILTLFFSLRRERLLAPSLLLSLRVGTLFLLLGSLLGFLMIANSSGTWQGLERWDDKGMFDFYTSITELQQEQTGGSLIVLHALGVHGLSLLPLAAWLLSYSTLTEKRREQLVAWLSGTLAVIILTLGIQAFRVRTLAQLDTFTALILFSSCILFLTLYARVFLLSWPEFRTKHVKARV